MSGAGIVSHLSVNQVAVKTLKELNAVNGFTKSVLQCDGHSGRLSLLEQVGRQSSVNSQEISDDRLLFQDLVHKCFSNKSGQVRDSEEGFRCCSLFRPHSRANGFIRPGSDITIIFKETFRDSEKFNSLQP